MKFLLILAVTMLTAFAAVAQTTGSTAFPDDAAAASASDIQQRLAGKTFNIKLADGSLWHVQYSTDGAFDFSTNKGFTDKGEWKAEDGKVCSKGHKIGSSCNEIRTKGDAIFLKRDNGEVVEFVEQH
ncbi:hypothetical protein [Paraburkholderia sp.]|uniref:hypothetical protein n=1 Tax=Paraburkholderia sp. TaxID=1926495 RepID=UPI002D4EE552|nr:hypothetical protein [Paraburkholderia sp.]HZZ02216.1 hypothetical protein [Paraburkholderia sp.]